MGLRFRKRIALGKFLRLNLSGSGVSVGLGPPGLNVNIGRRGLRKTVGLPGTGISYQTVSSWKNANGAPGNVQPVERSATTGNKFRVFGWLVFIGSILGLVWVIGHTGGRQEKSIPVVGSVGQQSKTVPTSAAAPTPGPLPKSTTPPVLPAPSIAPGTTPPKTPSIGLPGSGATPALSVDEVQELQIWLKAAGLDPGPIDGLIGSRTQMAIRTYQQRHSLAVTGLADRDLLNKLRRDHAP